MVGSYVSTKWFRQSCRALVEVSNQTAETRTWIVRAVFPTPPSPNTTSLYRVIFPCDMMIQLCADFAVRGLSVALPRLRYVGGAVRASLRPDSSRNVVQRDVVT